METFNSFHIDSNVLITGLPAGDKVKNRASKMETNFDSFSSASSSASTDFEIMPPICCGACNNYQTLTPAGEVAVMTYCSLCRKPVSSDECCTAYPQYTGGVPL
jgi:hypothetical protein